MTPDKLPLTMRRNADPLRLTFTVREDGEPIDMTTGWGFKMQVRSYPGAAGDPLLEITTTPTSAGSVITPTVSGFELAICKDDVPSGDFPADLGEREPWTGDYDILITEPGGDTNPWYYGSFTVEEGVTLA